MKKRVFLTRTLHDFALKELEKRYEIEVHRGKVPISREKLQSKIRDVEGIVCFPYDKIDMKIMDCAKKLKVISTYSVGFDHIDTDHAKKRGVRVGYTPNVLTDATADMAFSLLLDVSRRVSEGDRLIRAGRWKEIYGPYDYLGTGLQGKTVGILGMGRIGVVLARRAKAFDMKVTYHNRRRLSKTKEKASGVTYVSFDRLVRHSDFISIHVPHTEETDGLFNMEIFKKMKDTAFLINTSRGKVVNEADLSCALKKGIIAGAGLDVFETEPITGRHLLANLPNTVLVPHIGSSTRETRIKMAQIAVKNLKLGMAGKRPIYSVGY